MRVGIKIPTDSEHRYNAKNIVPQKLWKYAPFSLEKNLGINTSIECGQWL